MTSGAGVPEGGAVGGGAHRITVRHRTAHRYEASVASGHTVLRLLPRETPWQRVLQREVVVDPAPDHIADHVDAFGNLIRYVAVERPHDHLVVTATSLVEVRAPAVAPVGPPWEEVAHTLVAPGAPPEAVEMRYPSPLVPDLPALDAYAASSFAAGRPVGDAVRDLVGRIAGDFSFDPGFSDVTTPLADVLEARRGVCQDFTHLLVGCVRSLGLAARYVSGYIESAPPEGMPRLQGADASHAWASVWVPGWGWFDVDPTNPGAGAEQRVTVGWGRDYGDVAPVRGVVFGPPGEQGLEVAVDVLRQGP
jgi:transglutaminase-like putative cysteine protease